MIRGCSATNARKGQTTNAIEKRFREVRRRAGPMGTFQDKPSTDHILCAVFIHENKSRASAPRSC
jgi:transposase-like protein